MVIKGRSRSNGVQLADYLLNSKGNDRTHILEIRGTAQPDDLKRSLLEMSLSSELTKRGKLGLYHAQVNPAIGEDRPMTPEDWQKAADILEQHLGFDGQKRAIVLHEKEGRLHGHVVWERYDHDTGKLRVDGKNYEQHDKARAQIEQELGHERTPQKIDRTQEPDHKDRLTELWRQHPDGRQFVQEAEKAGYYVAQGNDRRPFRVVTPDGQSLDLTRQLEGIKTKEVRDRLQAIRADLWQEAEALKLSKNDRNRVIDQEPQIARHSENSRKISESQELFNSMKDSYKQKVEPEHTERPTYSYGFKIDQPPSLPREPDTEKNHSENKPEISESQAKAIAMIKAYEEQQAARQKMLLEAKEQTAKRNKTDEAAEILERYRKRQLNKDRNRDGPEI